MSAKYTGDLRGMLQESDDPLDPPEPPEPPGSEPDQEHLRLLNAQRTLIPSSTKKYKCHSCEAPDCTITAPCTSALEVCEITYCSVRACVIFLLCLFVTLW
jgi:hypothetical protein